MTDTMLDGGAIDDASDGGAAPVYAPAAQEPQSPAGDPSPSPAGEPAADDGQKGDDWRAALSKGDPDLLKFLGRYHSPDAAIKKFKEINDDIKSGKYQKPLADDASDEEKAAWRKGQGIPDAPDGYFQSLPEGVVVGEDDKADVEAFMAKMHAANASPAQVNAGLDAYYAMVEEKMAAQADLAREAEQAGVEELRSEWGGDFKRNLNVMHAHLDTLPKEVADVFRQGRGADGVPIGYKPEVLKWLTSLALEQNPVATVVPGAGANQAGAISDEIASIERVMSSDRRKYNSDEKMQARYRELVEARDKLKSGA